jgi:hypothetical protein
MRIQDASAFFPTASLYLSLLWIVAAEPQSYATEQAPVAFVERLDNGLSQVTSKHLKLVTDLPVTPEITDLCKMFDQAMIQWGEEFHVPRSEWIDGQATACLIVDRKRFTDLQYITTEVPTFREGYQLQDRLFMLEQPSAYYRRHLLLHEGTHWFLWRFLGGNGPPWFSEGICEMMATHQWSEQSGSLNMNWIPTDRESAPLWGRFKMIRDAMASGSAPSLDQILQYSDTAHRTDEPYAWSWAAMVFFSKNSRYRDALYENFLPNLRSHIGSEHKLTKDFKDRLHKQWPSIQTEWTAYVNDLDYGFSPEHSLPAIDLSTLKPSSVSNRVAIESSRGWQSSGIRLKQGDRVSITASGRVVVREASPHPWESEPQGISIQYYQGFPLGKLIAVVIPIDAPEHESSTTVRVTPFGIGKVHAWTSNLSGVLLLKVNEPSSQLFDNAGTFEVTSH